MKETELEWEKLARYLVRREMAEKVINAPQLGKLLDIDTSALKAKIQRGTFSAAFLLHVLRALNVNTLDLEKLEQDYENKE